MATRINTKFVLILGITVMTATGIVGGLWVLQIRGDTSRHIRNGDAMMVEARALEAAGDDAGAAVIFEKAVNEYGRAVNKEPADLSHLAKVEEALLCLRPQTQDQANEFDGMRLSILHREVRYQPTDAEVHLVLIRELHRIARWLDQADHWQELSDAADEMYTSLPHGDPQRVYARLYRGLAQMQLMGYAGAVVQARTATQEEIESALADIRAFVQAVPDSDLGNATLIEFELSIARQLRSEGSRSADAAFAEVEDSIAAAMEAVPDGPEVARIVVLKLVLEVMANQRPADDPELIAAMDRMVEFAGPSDDPMLLSDAGRLIRVADAENGMNRAIALMDSYVQANPDAHFQRFALAELYYIKRDLDRAREHCQVIIDARPVTVSMLSRIQPSLKKRSAGRIVDCEFRLWEQAEEAEKPAQFARVEAARDVLAAMVPEPDKEPLLLIAEGKIAVARQDHATAASRFERVIQLVSKPDVEMLWYASRSLEEIDQIGLARQRLVMALGLQPQNVMLRADKARLEYRMGLYDEARAGAMAVLEIEPDNNVAQRLITAMDTNLTRADGVPTTPMARSLKAAGDATTSGDIDGARDILLDSMAKTDDKLPFLTELVYLELRAGRTDAAKDYLAKAIVLSPGNTQLRKLAVGLNNEDQIEALKRYMADLYPLETDRVVNTLIHLDALANELDRLADRYEEEDDAEAAERARGRAAVAHQEAADMLARAEEIAPGHGGLLEFLFSRSLAAAEWDELESIVARAREADSDQAGGLVFKGRLALARKNYDEAIIALTEATKRKHYSALAWRCLGRAQERTGNFAEALRAYEQSYLCNPNDRIAVRWYVSLLIQTGERDRGLRVLRAARHAIPNDALLREVRLELEAEVGEAFVAMDERRQQYAARPDDHMNAMRLATLLAKTTPAYENIVNDDGSLRYKPDEWQMMAEGERQRALDQTAAEWLGESKAILAAIESEGEDRLDLAVLRADLLQNRGKIGEGEDLLRGYRDGHIDNVRAHLELAAYQRKTEHVNEAIATLESARPYQSAEEREADLALADLYFEQAIWSRAGELYEGVVAVKPDSGIQLRLVECFTKLERFDEADVLLANAVETGGQTFFTAMLRSSIAEGQADSLLSANLAERAELKDIEAMAALDEAERLMPASPLPHVRRAQRLYKEYNRTEEMTLLDDALRALDRADRVRAGADSTSRVRVEILRAKGDRRGAIGELTRLLQRTPDNIAARRLLVQLLIESRNYNGAMKVVVAAIERNPSIGLWHDARGELHVQRSSVAPNEAAARMEAGRAAEAFLEAYRLQPNATRLAKYSELALSVDEPDFRAVTTQIEAAGDMLNGSPLLRGLYAAALTGEGRTSEAIEQMRLAWNEHSEILELQPNDRRGVVNWYRMLQLVMTDSEPAEYEKLVTELADGEPSPLALVWAARTWSAPRDRDGIAHAIELLDTAAARCPSDDKELQGLIGLDRGQYYVAMENYRAAADSFEDVIELAAADPDVPDHALALNNAAFLYAEHLDDPAQAAAYAARADAVQPNDSSILDTLGWSLCKLGRYDEADKALRASITAGPSPDNHLHLAWVFYHTGKPEEAGLYLRKAEALRPSPGTKDRINELGDLLRR